MIFLLHGDNLPKTREVLTQLYTKIGVAEKREINAADKKPHELLELCSEITIYGEYPINILNITSLGSKEANTLYEHLAKVHKNANIILFAEKELTKTNAFLKNGQGITIKTVVSTNKPTENIFNFIDNLLLKKRGYVYQTLPRLLEHEDPFYLFSMVLYGIRNLAAATYGAPSIQKQNPYVQDKTKRQAQLYTMVKVKNLIKNAYEIDRNIKTGQYTIDNGLTLLVEKVLT